VQSLNFIINGNSSAMIDVDKQPKGFESSRPSTFERRKALASIATVATEAARRTKNILVWDSYLPHDCVKSMVKMGWHRST
jgi:hypothetical protein